MTYHALAGRFPPPRAVKWLDELSAEYGSAAVSATLAAVWPDATPSTAIGKCQDRLNLGERTTSRKPRRYGLTPEQAELAAFIAGGRDA